MQKMQPVFFYIISHTYMNFNKEILLPYSFLKCNESSHLSTGSSGNKKYHRSACKYFLASQYVDFFFKKDRKRSIPMKPS